MISVTITDRSGRTLSGQTLDAFYVSIEHARPFSVGLNCALGAREMRPYLAELARIADRATSAATRTPGCPTRSASTTSCRTRPRRCSREFAESGFVNIVGGCCGTTPDHIRAIARAVEGMPPRRARPAPTADSPTLTRLTRASRASRRSIDPARQQLPDDRRAHQRHRLEALRAAGQGRRLGRARPQVALDQVRGGANILDVNMDEGMLDSEACMTDVPELHRHRARDRAPADHDRQLEVVGHRSRAQVRAGQGHRQLDQPEGRRSRLPRTRRGLVRRYGAAMVVMAFDEQGQADTVDAQGRDLPARLPPAHRSRPASIRPTSSSTPTSSRSPPGSRSTTTTPRTSSRPRG